MAKIYERAGLVISISAAVLLVLSTAYDYSFLLALNLSFNEIPTTISDHIRSAIVWVPKAAIYILIFVLYEMFTRWLEDGKTEEELINNSNNPKFTRAFRKGHEYIFVVLLLLMVIGQILFTNSLQMLYLLGIAAWGYISIRVVRHPRLGEKLEGIPRRLIVATPIIVIWVGSMGYMSGEQIIRKSTPEWTVSIENRGNLEVKRLLGIRRFSSVAIIVDSNKNVSVISDDSVISSELTYNPLQNDTRACRWLNIGCPKEETDAPAF